MTIQIGWGWRVGLLYLAFVAMMIGLVVLSSRQKFDLVSKEYYKDEIAYQQVIDAGKNQAALTGTLVVKANGQTILIEFPEEFAGSIILGSVQFYSAVDKEWDRRFAINTSKNTMSIDRSLLRHTRYKLKISYSVEGRDYYQENDIDLAK